jgi:hypothetical protein
MHYVIQEWPGKDGAITHTSDEKVPTEILYKDYQAQWGFQIPHGEPRHLWFKLRLNGGTDNQSYLSTTLEASNELPPSYDKSCQDLSTDYLKCIRDHVIGHLERSIGKAVVKSTTIEFTITVPAMWTDKAKKLTLDCAKAAGLGEQLRIISEPEAAGIYTLSTMDVRGLKQGDNVILFDAGGGTVDVISLKIEKMGNPVQLVESVPGDGSKCGASYLNRRFRKMLIESYSSLKGWDDETLQEAELYFEDYIKKYFSGTESYRVPLFSLEDDPSQKISKGRLHLSAADVEAIFAAVIASATTLLSTQLNRTPNVKKVVIVGGFSGSPYLRSCVLKIIRADIEPLIPPYARTAVARGALIKSLAEENPASANVSVVGRAARKHYGVKINVPFDDMKHRNSLSPKYVSPYIHYQSLFLTIMLADGGMPILANTESI